MNTPSRIASVGWACFAAALCIALVRYVHADSFRTMVNAHGMLHLAVIGEFQGPADLHRPLNPFYAGEPIPYYWFYHYVLAMIARATGLNPLYAVEVLVGMSLVGLWVAGALLGRRLFGSLSGGLFVGLLAIAGTNVLGGWRFLALLALGNRPPPDTGVYLWGLAHPMITMARISDRSSLYGPLTSFFLNVTSRPVGLALLLILIWCLANYLTTVRMRWAVATGGVAALGSALAPMVGLPAGLSLAAGLGAVALMPAALRVGLPLVENRRPWLLAAGAIVAGLLLGSPTYYHLFARAGGGGIALGLRREVLVAVIASAGPVVALGLIGAWRSTGPVRQFMVALLIATALQLLAALVIILPRGNDSNFFHAAGFLIAPAAAAALVPAASWNWGRRVLWSIAIVVCFSISSAVVLLSYLDRPPIPAVMADGGLARQPADGPLASAYHWIRTNAEPDAMIIADPGRPILTAMGNQPELPVMTGHPLFTAYLDSYMVDANPDAPRRVAIAAAAVEGDSLTPEDMRYVAALDRPAYIFILHGDDLSRRNRLRARYGPAVFAADSVQLYRYPRR